MKTGIHPEYMVARVTCACGRVTETRATVPELHVDICSHCHPFFTGRQKLVDTAGRVERFRAKYGNGEAAEAEDDPAAAEAEPTAAATVEAELAVEDEAATDAVADAEPSEPEEDKPATE